MKLKMKLEELDESLESQEELLRLEREKFKALEMNLTNESKKNKKLQDSLKTKDSILLEVEEALTSERGKVDELTKKLSLVKDTHANLRSDNEKLQESLTSLQAIHATLEIQFNTLVETTPKARKSSNSSSPSTSNGCACCYNIDIQTCATNHAEMNAMRKEITRLTQLVHEDEVPSHKQVPKMNPSRRVSEFEKHIKGFGSRYLRKY
jgi:chromosome segregation ATPase